MSLGRAPAPANGGPRHFLDIDCLDTETLRGILDLSHSLKTRRGNKPKGAADENPLLEGRMLAMLFDKPSTRTRISFDVAMRQLGGGATVITSSDTHLSRGETPADTARVLSRYVDGIMVRTTAHDRLMEIAGNATVPVINALTDYSHPCQVMADVMTFEEHLGPIAGRTVAWSGDGNNMVVSWIHAALRFGFEIRIASPPDFAPPASVVDRARRDGARILVTEAAREAVRDAHCVVTDTWVSMGDADAERRHRRLEPYRVDQALMALARPDAIFMHCLPAHRGEEMTEDVIDGPQSVVWDEAENRLHAQKGILAWCLG